MYGRFKGFIQLMRRFFPCENSHIFENLIQWEGRHPQDKPSANAVVERLVPLGEIRINSVHENPDWPFAVYCKNSVTDCGNNIRPTITETCRRMLEILKVSTSSRFRGIYLNTTYKTATSGTKLVAIGFADPANGKQIIPISLAYVLKESLETTRRCSSMPRSL